MGSSYKGNHITLSFHNWLISVNIMSSRFYDVSECPSFLRLNIFHHMCMPHFKKSIHLSMDRRGILGSNSDSVFTLLRKCHIVFHSGCNILYSHQQYTRVPISSLSHNTCYCLFLIVATLIGTRWSLTVVWTYISLMISDAGHFMCIITVFNF